MANPSTKSSTSARGNKRAIWIIGGTVVLAGAGFAAWYFLRPKPGADDFSFPENENPPALPPPAPPTTTRDTTVRDTSNIRPKPAPQHKYTDLVFPLQKGRRGKRVALIQSGLNRQGARLKVDGVWGGNTQAALDKARVPTPIDRGGFRSILRFLGAKDPYGLVTLSGLGYTATDPVLLGQHAVTIRPTVGYDAQGRVIDLAAGLLLGTVQGREGGFLEVLTSSGAVLMVDFEAVTTA